MRLMLVVLVVLVVVTVVGALRSLKTLHGGRLMWTRTTTCGPVVGPPVACPHSLLAGGVEGSRGDDGALDGASDENRASALEQKIAAVEYCLDNFGNSDTPEGSVAFCNLVKRYRKFDEAGLLKYYNSLVEIQAKAPAPIPTQGNVYPPSSRSHRPYCVR